MDLAASLRTALPQADREEHQCQPLNSSHPPESGILACSWRNLEEVFKCCPRPWKEGFWPAELMGVRRTLPIQPCQTWAADGQLDRPQLHLPSFKHTRMHVPQMDCFCLFVCYHCLLWTSRTQPNQRNSQSKSLQYYQEIGREGERKELILGLFLKHRMCGGSRVLNLFILQFLVILSTDFGQRSL